MMHATKFWTLFDQETQGNAERILRFKRDENFFVVNGVDPIANASELSPEKKERAKQRLAQLLEMVRSLTSVSTPIDYASIFQHLDAVWQLAGLPSPSALSV
jgi:5,10-methenyltetrahydromethanopterin hydrogenase